MSAAALRWLKVGCAVRALRLLVEATLMGSGFAWATRNDGDVAESVAYGVLQYSNINDTK
jgi:hypothetical protein